MNKLTLMLDSTALGSAACILNYIRTTVGEPSAPEKGAYREPSNAAAVYGIAVHKFVDTMFKTSGYYPLAKIECEKAFNVEKQSPSDKQEYLADHRHLLATCYNLWTNYIEEEPTYEILSVPQDCYWCKGKGLCPSEISSAVIANVPENHNIEFKDGYLKCTRCDGTGKVTGPATEITFRIPYYEDDTIIVYLCGTIDTVGKFRGGCYAIRDWKTTSSWRKDYIDQYELSRQLRIYTLACKLMARSHPDSILGKVGATNMGAFIDAIKVKSKANENEYERSSVMQLSNELLAFERQLQDFCKKVSHYIQTNYFPKEGILNGSCVTLYGKCKYWHACKSNDTVAKILLDREFKRKVYNPLCFND